MGNSIVAVGSVAGTDASGFPRLSDKAGFRTTVRRAGCCKSTESHTEGSRNSDPTLGPMSRLDGNNFGDQMI